MAEDDACSERGALRNFMARGLESMSRQLQLHSCGGKWACKPAEQAVPVTSVSVAPVVTPEHVEVDKCKRKEMCDILVEKYGGDISEKKRRAVYSEQEREVVSAMLLDAKGNCHLVADACRMAGFTSLDRRTVQRIKGGTHIGARGKPVNKEFELAVLSRVLFQTLSKVTQVTDITGNILHSLSMLSLAATALMAENTKFRECPIVNRLHFSLKWAAGVCRRNRLAKRAITCKTTADMPDPLVIRNTQRCIQQEIVAGGYVPADMLSCDESGINWKAGETHLYCPVGSERPPADGDDKLRITIHLGGNGEGDMMPSHTILKTACKDDARQEASTKLRVMLGKLAAMQPDEGWQLGTWTKCLDFGKGPKTYVRTYLINRDGDLITLQKNAWMDSAGCICWLELVVVPWALRHGRRPFIVWDNFSAHINAAQVIEEGQVQLNVPVKFALLPPRCTRNLQVMDLVTNAVLKAAMRKLRLARLYNDFQNFRFQYAQATLEAKPVFQPPEIKEVDGIVDLLRATRDAFHRDAFRDGMKRAFIKVGLVKLPSDRFELYPKEHPSTYKQWVKGIEAFAYEPQGDKVFCIDELFDSLCLTRYENLDELHAAEERFDATNSAETSDDDSEDDSNHSELPRHLAGPAVAQRSHYTAPTAASAPPAANHAAPANTSTPIGTHTTVISFSDGTTMTHTHVTGTALAPAPAPVVPVLHTAPAAARPARTLQRPAHLNDYQ
jgi:hypothetical protein